MAKDWKSELKDIINSQQKNIKTVIDDREKREKEREKKIDEIHLNNFTFHFFIIFNLWLLASFMGAGKRITQTHLSCIAIQLCRDRRL